MSNFKVPEYDKEGNKKSELTGDFARMDEGGDVDITNLKIEFYKEGAVETVVTAPQCTYNQEDGTAVSKSNVKMVRENMEVTGVGFSYDKTNELLIIYSHAKVVLKNVKHKVIPGEEP